MLEFRALGGLGVVDGVEQLSVGGPRQRRLTAALLIDRNKVVSVDRLAEIVFAGEPTPAAATTLRSYVARLRRVVDRPGSDCRVVTRAPGYVLEVRDEAFDVPRFERSVAACRELLARGDAAEAGRALRAGLELWRGRAYAEFADEDWVQPEAQRLEELRLVAHELVADAGMACGRASEVASELEPLVAENPLRDGLQARLMLALYRSGRQVEALRVYQAHREVLATEFGLDPPPELAELEGHILVHDEGLRELEPGEVRLRGYRLAERLGSGADGTVYAARLPGVDRDIVVRVVPEVLADHPDFVRTFEADARRVAALRHEAVVPLYDWWREPGAAYVVMRRMRGGTLRDRLATGALDARGVATLVARVGGALAAAAEAGISHGRVVADSILLDEEGRSFLADFPLGTAQARVPGDDVRDLAAVVTEALTGGRAYATTPTGVPTPVADVLATAVSGEDPPGLDAFVSAVSAALSGERGAPAAERPNPYKGLRAFDETDAEDFFGRDALVEDVLGRLAGNGPSERLVLVVGGSGSGKSSLVRAGVLPRVRRGAVAGSDGWFVAAMVPGASPFHELAEALRRVAVVDSDRLPDELAAGEGGIDRVLRRVVPEGGQLLLIVDQLEELFTLAGEHEQEVFLAGLARALSVVDSRLRVVATLRADFYGHPLRFERFGAAVGDATVPIAAMSPAELEAAIVAPAERIGGRADPALVAELVGALVREPAALPSLQYTLYELAERRPDRGLTLAAYRELGGVDAAIAARAEELYRSLEDDAREAVRRLFERLVVVGVEGEPTRRRALRNELAAAAGQSAGAVLGVIEVWARARLLTLDRHPDSREPTVEVAHEALLREWPRLRGWLEEDRERIVALGQLREAATAWAELDEDPGALYRGARLDTALALADARPGALPVRERKFLDASRAERDRERRREAEQHARTARANRRLRVQLLALAVALVVALGGGLMAVRQRDRAQDERQTAVAQERVATARELAAAAKTNVDVDPERSILLAMAAVERTRSVDGSVLPEAEEALHTAVTASRIERHLPGVGGAVDWSPDGSVFVGEHPDPSGVVDIRDARTGASLRAFDGHDDNLTGVSFNPAGTLLGTTGDDGTARIWDHATGEELVRVGGSGLGGVWGPSFSADGSMFAAAWWDEEVVRVVDVATGRVQQEIQLQSPGPTSFEPTGARIAVGTGSAAAVLDVRTGDELLRLAGNLGGLLDVEWSPDGTSIATAGADASARVYDATSGDERFALVGHRYQVLDLDWGPGSDTLVTGSWDGTAKYWILAEGLAREWATLSARDTRNGVTGVTFSPDGLRVMTGNQHRSATTVWDVSRSGDEEVGSLVTTAFGFARVAYTPDGRYILGSAPAGSVALWDAQDLTYVKSLGAPPSAEPPSWIATPWPPPASPVDVQYIEASRDGRFVAASTVAGVRVWDVESGEELVSLRASVPGAWPSLRWSPTENLLAVAAFDDDGGFITVLDSSGRTVQVLRDEGGFGALVGGFSPDGERLITSRTDPERRLSGSAVDRVVVWEWHTGRVLRTFGSGVAFGRVTPSPSGTLLATPTPTEGIELWNWATGERLASLTGDTGRFVEMSFSPDGSRLASLGDDGQLRMWDPHSGEQLLGLRAHATAARSLSISPDGARLVTAGLDGIVRVWALDVDELMEIAEREVTRSLTDEECRQYLHVARCP